MTRSIALSILAALSFAACSGGTKPLGPGGPDSGTATDSGSTPAPDAAALAPDAGPPPDSGPPPARHLVDVKLFGDLPLDNAVLDPQFDLHSGNWLAVGGFTSARGPRGVRLVWQDFGVSPAGVPAFLLQNRMQDPTDTIVMGSVMAVKGPLSASVWIGRNSADASTLTSVKPSIVATLASTGLEQAYDLVPDTTTSSRTIGQLVWQKYSTMIMDAPAGIMTFAFQDPADKPMLATAPVVRSMAASDLGRISSTLGGRALTANEAAAMREMAKWQRRHLGERPRKLGRPEALRRLPVR